MRATKIHSMTSSARPSRENGTVRPNASAGIADDRTGTSPGDGGLLVARDPDPLYSQGAEGWH